ncbi:MAG: hypothetical protein IKP00_04155 [Victivallales bacterium]|nr:hypothetical protein [Bacteroidales bacterium]MBR4673636.1 hypothetical protein [Victivallales bacterium]
MKLFIKTQGRILGPMKWERILKTADRGCLAPDATVSDNQVNWLNVDEARKLLEKKESTAAVVFSSRFQSSHSLSTTPLQSDSDISHKCLEWTELKSSMETESDFQGKSLKQINDAQNEIQEAIVGAKSQSFSRLLLLESGMAILLVVWTIVLWLNRDSSSSKDHDDKGITGEVLTSRQINELATPSVLAVWVETNSGWSTGSGIPVTQRDVLTNRHVVEEIGEGGEVLVYNEKWDNPRGKTAKKIIDC